MTRKLRTASPTTRPSHNSNEYSVIPPHELTVQLPEPEVCTQSTPPETVTLHRQSPRYAHSATARAVHPHRQTRGMHTVHTARARGMHTVHTARARGMHTVHTTLVFNSGAVRGGSENLNERSWKWNYLNDSTGRHERLVVEDMGNMFFDNMATPLEMELGNKLTIKTFKKHFLYRETFFYSF